MFLVSRCFPGMRGCLSSVTFQRRVEVDVYDIYNVYNVYEKSMIDSNGRRVWEKLKSDKESFNAGS